jgi:hypothetical protein
MAQALARLHVEGPTGNTVYDLWKLNGEPLRGRR